MKKIVTLVLAAALTVGLVIVSGAIPIGASSGHWAVTSWMLDFVKRRSVAMRAIGLDAPPLDAPAVVLAGAAHYEDGCRPCHGRPGLLPPVVPTRMTPHPPDLQRLAGRWAAEELFYIVKHGIKFTGMPAWPYSDRDDEVWAVVAFVRRLPTMDGGEYDRQVFAGRARSGATPGVVPAVAVEPAARLAGDVCARCHGVNGQGDEQTGFPRLAGQRRDYLALALRAFAGGGRRSGIMSPIAARLDEAMMDAVSDVYARRRPDDATTARSSNVRGAEIARLGVPSQDVPACDECHGRDARDRNPAYPVLAGQVEKYLALQLQLLNEGRRGGSAFEPIMRGIAGRLTAAQMADVAAHYASLVP